MVEATAPHGLRKRPRFLGQLLCTGGADRVEKGVLCMRGDIDFLLPMTLLVADLLAPRADGNHPPEDFNLIQRRLELGNQAGLFRISPPQFRQEQHGNRKKAKPHRGIPQGDEGMGERMPGGEIGQQPHERTTDGDGHPSRPPGEPRHQDDGGQVKQGETDLVARETIDDAEHGHQEEAPCDD